MTYDKFVVLKQYPGPCQLNPNLVIRTLLKLVSFSNIECPLSLCNYLLTDRLQTGGGDNDQCALPSLSSHYWQSFLISVLKVTTRGLKIPIMYFIPLLQFLQWMPGSVIFLTLILSNIGISLMLMYLKILEQKMTQFCIFLCRLFRIYLSIYFHFISRPRIIQSFPRRWSSFLPNCQWNEIWWTER